MITLQILPEQIDRAEKLYSFNELNGSITNGKSNIYGALGEIIVYDYLLKNGFDVAFNSTYDYDLVVNSHKVDVKTKRTTVIPKEDYFCSIPSFNIRQKCDFYFFARVREDMSCCYLLGYKRKSDFFNEAALNKKGEKDKNNWLFKSDCYNLEVSKLNKFTQKDKL